MIRKCFMISLALVFSFAPVLPAGTQPQASGAQGVDDGTMKGLVAVAGSAMMEPRAYDYLEEVSDDIGARVTGSPEAQRAIDWGVATMKAIGLENVHTEPFQLFRGWTRVSADAELESPIHRQLMVDSMGWVGSTPAGGVEADLVGVNAFDLDNEIKNNATKWRGKILLVYQKGEPPADRMMTFVKFGDFLKAAQANGAAAVIGGQGGRTSAGMHLTHTGALGFNVSYDIPVVSTSAEDQAQLERYLARGVPVKLKINVQNRFSDGPVPSANVIGEIRGTEHPEQILVVGGHLDSWDLASGATDNGCGTSTTLGAAAAIMKAGVKPRRTIRFVLFTGEEQGLVGSLAYVKQHKDEMANHLGAVILDAGQGAVTGLQLGGRQDLIAATATFAKSLQAFGKLTVDDEVEFGTDTASFTLQGLPGINLNQDTSDYKYTHHSAVDTFDKVSAELLDRNAAIMALTAYWIADRPDRYATPWTREQTARMLVEKHDDVILKALGLWPFGDLGSDLNTTMQ
ncbi:MAG: M20/M25/M40 family metallo-hydrolase [Candidatus Acidiferrales bacterium]